MVACGDQHRCFAFRVRSRNCVFGLCSGRFCDKAVAATSAAFYVWASRWDGPYHLQRDVRADVPRDGRVLVETGCSSEHSRIESFPDTCSNFFSVPRVQCRSHFAAVRAVSFGRARRCGDVLARVLRDNSMQLLPTTLTKNQ